MKKFRVFFLSLLILLLAGTVSAASKPLPYAIVVNRAWNTVTIYTPDESGAYTVPYKAMLCSTAKPGYVTPPGEFKLTSYRVPWQYMIDGTYGQYACQFKGNYLFHSICYSDDSHDAMIRTSYNNLGNAVSLGCVRLETADAKWIFDNCPAGTPVTILDDYDSPGPLGRPARTVSHISEEGHNGWDPTDPDEENPWRNAEVTAIEISQTKLSLKIGETAVLTATYEPKIANVCWESSDETIAKVDETGCVIGLSKGTATITAAGFKGAGARCIVTVIGDPLPFTDVQPGAWYYTTVRDAVAKKLFRGMDEQTFAPDTTMSRAMVVQVLYQMAGMPKTYTKPPFDDVTKEDWFFDAIAWASKKGILTDIAADSFRPNEAMTRQEMATVLWRYANAPKADADLSCFKDHSDVADFAAQAVMWAVSREILQGSNDNLLPDKSVTRAEAAALLLRYKK